MSSRIHEAKGFEHGTSAAGAPEHGPGSAGSPMAFRRKTAICSRVTGARGQKFPPPQPAVTPASTIASIQGAKGLEQGTSANAPVHVLGWWPGLSRVFMRRTAICSRVTGTSGQ
jgi:hypothetical protein